MISHDETASYKSSRRNSLIMNINYGDPTEIETRQNNEMVSSLLQF